MATNGFSWPNFFVVGAQKCGTTSLYEYMKNHREIFVPELKEPEYFSTPAQSKDVLYAQWCPTLEDYQRNYAGSSGYRIVADFSTGYLWDKTAAGRIQQASPGAKIIILLREPIVRAHSAYLMLFRDGLERAPTFQEALEWDERRDQTSWFTAFNYVQAGLYYEQVRRYIEIFGRERVLVLMFEELIKNPEMTLARIAEYLGVDGAPFKSADVSRAHNTFRMPRNMAAYRIFRNPVIMSLRHALLPKGFQAWLQKNPLLYTKSKPSLDMKTRKYLQGLYAPDVERLEELLGRKLPELRKSWS